MRHRMLVVAQVTLVLSVACGGDVAKARAGSTPDQVHAVAKEMCEAHADCEGTGIEACVAEADRQIAAAGSNGCLDIMATWYRCLEGSSTCTTGDGQTDASFTDEGECSDEEELAEDCRKGRL